MARHGSSFDSEKFEAEDSKRINAEFEGPSTGPEPSRTQGEINEHLVRDTSLDDLVGIESIRSSLQELIVYPVRFADIYASLGTEPSTGVILHGVPGSGKTTIARAVAGTLQVPFFHVPAPEIIFGIAGESEAFIRKVFAKAMEVAPSIVFIDDIDIIASKSDHAQGDINRRIVSQLVSCLDDIHTLWRTRRLVVQVIAATSRLESLDSTLRRTGRFDREIALRIPTRECRETILRRLARHAKVTDDVDYKEIAMRTPGYVCSDLLGLMKEATVAAIRRMHKHNELPHGESSPTISDESSTPSCSLEKADFFAAMERIQPSALREGFTIAPNVTWSDIGALHDTKKELFLSIVLPIRYPSLYKHYGIHQSMGVLLHGPPGCGKTLLAKAVANEAGANFISIKGPEILNKYVGESEKSIRTLFSRARASAPCVLFFDELDALAPSRGSSSANSSSERVVNQLLTEMDGMDERDITGVYVVAATNRPDLIDPALKRPGRLDKCLMISLPSAQQRCEIMQTISRKLPLADDINLQRLADDNRLDGFSGADLASLFREAGLVAVQNELSLDLSTYDERIHEHIAKENNLSASIDVCLAVKERKIADAHMEVAISKIHRSVASDATGSETQ
ncbi:vesicular transport protein [Perkinsela sp. CCAP 1560/4]|nr:vesicular transport protein [Perkinsela sp. CCAP 1560/4]|eukprot:KNH06386.1 vesicular transport protein [Perkinsela sp. CCAP 1560/4]